MELRHSRQAFLARYGPVFIGAFFCALLALVMASALLGSTYLHRISGYRNYSGLDMGVMSVILSVGNALVVRGRAWGVWIMVGCCVLSFSAVMFTISYTPDLFTFSTGLLFSLLGLYLLNTKRHRQMRAELVLLRHERERYKAGFRPPRTQEMAQARLEYQQARRLKRENRRKWKAALNPRETSHEHPATDTQSPAASPCPCESPPESTAGSCDTTPASHR